MPKHHRRIHLPGKLAQCLLFAALPSAIFYAVALSLMQAQGFKTIEVIRDPAQQSGASSMIGFLSNIGTWLWVASASISLFSASMAKGRPKRQELLIFTGLLSLMLAVDDFFMVHDRYLDQRICYAAYALIALGILARHYRMLQRSECLSFIVACTFLGMSVLFDMVQYRLPFSYDQSQILEEGFKFIGGGTLLYFNMQMSRSLFMPNAHTGAAEEAPMEAKAESAILFQSRKAI